MGQAVSVCECACVFVCVRAVHKTHLPDTYLKSIWFH